jgi:hypothetical protein
VGLSRTGQGAPPLWMHQAVELDPPAQVHPAAAAFETPAAAGEPEPDVAAPLTAWLEWPTREVRAYLEWDPYEPAYRLTPQGEFFDATEWCIGYLRSDGWMVSCAKDPVAYASADGRLWAADDAFLGFMDAQRRVWAADDRCAGWLDTPNLFAAAPLLVNFTPWARPAELADERRRR